MSNQTALPELRFGTISRRGFLRGLLIAAGTAGAGMAVEGCAPQPGTDAGGRKYLFFDRDEALLMEKLGEAVIPTQRGFPSLAEAQVLRRADEELSFVGATLRDELHAALGAMLWAPFIYGRWALYTSLDINGRRDVLKHMLNSRNETLRAVGTNLKVLVQMFYFGHPSTWAMVQYDGPFSHLPPVMSEQRLWYAQQAGIAK